MVPSYRTIYKLRLYNLIIPSTKEIYMIRLLLTMIFLFPLLLTAETFIVKTKAPQNRYAVFQYRVPKGYDKNRREMYRVLVIFDGRNTDGKADASGRICWKNIVKKWYFLATIRDKDLTNPMLWLILFGDIFIVWLYVDAIVNVPSMPIAYVYAFWKTV
jgi:hypothetical protein